MRTAEVQYSDALVDYSGFGKTLGDLEQGFSLLEFLDLCAVLEGIVLHDRLVLVGGNSFTATARARAIVHTRLEQRATEVPPREGPHERWRTILNPLIEAGVLVDAPSTKPADPGPKPAGGRHPGPKLTRSTELDSWYEVGRLLGAEKQLGCAPLPLIRQRPFYERGGQARPRHTVCDLMGQYQDLASALADLRLQARLAMAPFLVVPIPPLPLLILKISSSYEDVLARALDIREDYADLRASLRSLRELLADPSVPPRKKLSAMNSWQYSWETLRNYDRRSGYVQLASNALDIPDLNSAIEELGLNSVQLTNILKFAVTRSVHYFRSWRVRLLHSIARRYLATPDSELNNEIRRLFGTELTSEDLGFLQREWGGLGLTG